MLVNNSLSKKINIFCLLAAIIAVLLLPLKKKIWYDETVSMLCSKGISHDTHLLYTGTTNSATIAQLNTAGNVFNATVLDNGNSFLFNIGLHWFTMLFGNSVTTYTLFSKLCSISLLLAFYVLCNLLFENSIFTSVAIILLAVDGNFLGMSHEIRAYSMGMFFVTLAAVYFYKFMYRQERPLYLFLLGLFSVAAVLSHFLTVYIILVFLGGLFLFKRSTLFSVKNLLALLLPVCLIGVFFYFAYPGLQLMNKQNHTIQQKLATTGFSLSEVFLRSMKYTAINFKAVFPAVINKLPVILFSFLLPVGLYIAGAKTAANNTQKRNLHLLFLLGISSTLFLAFLSIKSRHYTAIYYRYYCFCIPFCCLFMAYLIYVFFSNPKINNLVKSGILAVILLPAVMFFLIATIEARPPVHYNHAPVAAEIVQDKVMKVEVPEWRDAFILQSLLPEGYKIDYVLNPASPYFTLYKANTEEKIFVLKDPT